MSAFYEATPPQLDPAIVQKLAVEVRHNGFAGVGKPALEVLQNESSSLGTHLDELAMELSHAASNSWPSKTMQYGAAIALQGYRLSGYAQEIDADSFEVGLLMAVANGIPDTYIETTPVDANLLKFSRRLSHLISTESHGYPTHEPEPLLNLGLGFTRYYLQQVISDAA